MLLGIGVTLLANVFFLASSYMVKVWAIGAGEVMVYRSLVQMVVFAVWSVIRSLGDSDERQQQERSWLLWPMVILCNTGLAFVLLLVFVAVKMLPLSDFMVFTFSSPVFTLAFSACILR